MSNTPTPNTREQWLSKAVSFLDNHLFQPKHLPLPSKIRVSVGWPGGRADRSKAVGQHWKPTASSDQHHEIFISPKIASDSLEILSTLVHELVHAQVYTEYPNEGHGKIFKRVCDQVGLVGEAKYATAGSSLREGLLAEFIGLYGRCPSGSIDYSTRKKDTTRLIKAECNACGYVIRTSRKWIEDIGLPICKCGGEFHEPKAD